MYVFIRFINFAVVSPFCAICSLCGLIFTIIPNCVEFYPYIYSNVLTNIFKYIQKIFKNIFKCIPNMFKYIFTWKVANKCLNVCEWMEVVYIYKIKMSGNKTTENVPKNLIYEILKKYLIYASKESSYLSPFLCDFKLMNWWI